MHVLVCGAGYAGITAARRLERRLPQSAELTVIDRASTHVIQHELHRVVRRPALAEVIAIPVDSILDRAEVIRATVTSIDKAAGQVTLSGDETLEYDLGIVALGGSTAHYGLPGIEEHAIPLKRLEHARRLARAVEAMPAGGSVVVGGAGLAGVQVAGELAAIVAARDDDATVRLLEQTETVAPTFPGPFRAAVTEALEARGVEVDTGRRVTAATESTVELADGSAIDYDVLVWTGGLQGPSALGDERPRVRSDLRLGRSTFAIGDAARMVDADGKEAPATAQAAIEAGRVTASNVARLVEHRLGDGGGFEPRLERFRFDPWAWTVSVGDGAVAQVGDRVVVGRPALALKVGAGVRYLSSVGAAREALRLLHRELGLPEGDSGTGDGGG